MQGDLSSPPALPLTPAPPTSCPSNGLRFPMTFPVASAWTLFQHSLPWPNPDTDFSWQLSCPTTLDISRLLSTLPGLPRTQHPPTEALGVEPRSHFEGWQHSEFCSASLSQHVSGPVLLGSENPQELKNSTCTSKQPLMMRTSAENTEKNSISTVPEAEWFPPSLHPCGHFLKEEVAGCLT